jgi:hypothetical protein
MLHPYAVFEVHVGSSLLVGYTDVEPTPRPVPAHGARTDRVAWLLQRPPAGAQVQQLGPNAFGDMLEPGRVGDCYLGLQLPPPPAGEPEAGTVLIVAPAALLYPGVPQPAGSLVYELLSGHPDRQAGELVFLADLTCELRAWPDGTWARVGIDPAVVAQAVVGCWRDGHLDGRQFDELDFEEARSLQQPAMTYVRSQLRARLTGRLHRAHRRWLHPTSGRQPSDHFL